jgi:hypothetical protein
VYDAFYRSLDRAGSGPTTRPSTRSATGCDRRHRPLARLSDGIRRSRRSDARPALRTIAILTARDGRLARRLLDHLRVAAESSRASFGSTRRPGSTRQTTCHSSPTTPGSSRRSPSSTTRSTTSSGWPARRRPVLAGWGLNTPRARPRDRLGPSRGSTARLGAAPAVDDAGDPALLVERQRAAGLHPQGLSGVAAQARRRPRLQGARDARAARGGGASPAGYQVHVHPPRVRVTPAWRARRDRSQPGRLGGLASLASTPRAG